ncbi:MAG: hypothetical protein JWN80_3127 [Microbacteriaceae bacterium]|jgi:hypothetical protein|nr:hypothetical protein [Microbacteriaceae bacterium]
MQNSSTQFFPGWQLVSDLEPAEYAMLERSIELVVLAQAFSIRGLQLALRLRNSVAEKMAYVLESIGIVSTGGWEEQRPVLVAQNELAAILGELRGSRGLAAIA